MTLIIYGAPESRTLRVLWVATELDLDYQHVPFTYDDPALKQAGYLGINPAGAIPAIVDDGFALTESLAINLYLAKKQGTTGAEPLYPQGLTAEAEVWRWTLWAQIALEPWLQRDVRLAALRQAIGDHAHASVAAALAVLEQSLSDRRWLAASHFTIADLNVATVLSRSRTGSFDLASYPRVESWLTRCNGRPAAIETRRRFLP